MRSGVGLRLRLDCFDEALAGQCQYFLAQARHHALNLLFEQFAHLPGEPALQQRVVQPLQEAGEQLLFQCCVGDGVRRQRFREVLDHLGQGGHEARRRTG